MNASMPSPVGHVLAGTAIGLWLDPGTRAPGGPIEASSAAPHVLSSRGMPSVVTLSARQFTWPLATAAAASLPDADLLIPHFHRTATHSVFCTALIMIVSMVVTGKVTGRISLRWTLALGLAHASHILMDWLGADPSIPQGIQALWPASHAFYISGWDFFPETARQPIFAWDAFAKNAYALAFEVTTIGPLVWWAWLTRTRRIRVRTFDQAVQPPPSA